MTFDNFNNSCPYNKRKKLIKRVVALEGDHIWSRDENRLNYIPLGHCWVEGDEGGNSIDSNQFGPIPQALIEGRVQYILWPWKRWGSIPPVRLPSSNMSIGAEEPTREELEAAEQLKKLIQKDDYFSPIDQEFCTTFTLVRYLRARDHNLRLAREMLVETLQWRREVRPERMICKRCIQNPRSHTFRPLGIDKLGRPVLYSCFVGLEDRSADNNVKHLIYYLETIFSNSFAESYIWVLDFVGFSAQDLNPTVGKKSLKLFSDHYPERLYLAIVVDAPLVFSSLWAILKPFISKNTAKKIEFRKVKTVRPLLEELMPSELVDKFFQEFEENRNPEIAKDKQWWNLAPLPPPRSWKNPKLETQALEWQRKV
eukprot:jgi/Galph1/150/GphlegSOOS_G4932.1